MKVLTANPTEGSPTTLVVSASDPGGSDDPLTYQFDFNNDGVYETSTPANAAQYVFPVAGIYPVKLGWNGIPVSLGRIHFSLTIYPPLVVCI